MDFELLFDEFRPGDEYDVPPSLGSRIITELLKVSAEFYLDGNVIVIESIPGKAALSP